MSWVIYLYMHSFLITCKCIVWHLIQTTIATNYIHLSNFIGSWCANTPQHQSEWVLNLQFTAAKMEHVNALYGTGAGWSSQQCLYITNNMLWSFNYDHSISIITIFYNLKWSQCDHGKRQTFGWWVIHKKCVRNVSCKNIKFVLSALVSNL